MSTHSRIVLWQSCIQRWGERRRASARERASAEHGAQRAKVVVAVAPRAEDDDV